MAENTADAFRTNDVAPAHQTQVNLSEAPNDWNISLSVWEIAKCLKMLPKDKTAAERI